MRRASVAALGVLLIAAAAGCAPAARTPVERLEALDDGEMVVVGRVELVPALRKGEQRIRGIGTSGLENRMLLIVDERARPLPRDLAIADYAGRVEAPLGETFFVRSRSAAFHVLGGVLFLDFGGDTQQRAYFPGGFQVDARPGERAVYVGTLRYHRDEFFEVTRVTVVDDYVEANAEFTRRFGSRHSLRKSLMKRK
ncbi:MAG TPA: hypothetical protein VFZ54_12225 [Burkholderiales bacterium]